MDIPEPFKRIILENHKKNKTNIGAFFEGCFVQLIRELHITDYQARAQKTGDMFEYALWFIINEQGINLDDHLEITTACMSGAGKLDFGIKRSGKIVCGIEAKGSSEGVSTRPALKRTDTVKKAISQAYQFKKTFPNVPFYLVTNVVPTQGNAHCMLKLAEGDIIDKVVDVTNPQQFTEFITKLKTL